MIFKTAILQQRAKYRAYDYNTQTIIDQMAAAVERQRQANK